MQTWFLLLAGSQLVRGAGYGCGDLCRTGKTFSGQGAQSSDAEDKHMFLGFFSCGGSEPITRNGTYIEMGALDGVTMSNTHYFDATLGWGGLLVEPNPRTFKSLASGVRRKSRNHLINAAACSTEGTVPFVVGVKSHEAPSSHIADATYELSLQHNYTVAVRCARLDRLLAEVNITHVHFFSLDVQGLELQAGLAARVHSVKKRRCPRLTLPAVLPLSPPLRSVTM